jgi:hypothetical protein
VSGLQHKVVADGEGVPGLIPGSILRVDSLALEIIKSTRMRHDRNNFEDDHA